MHVERERERVVFERVVSTRETWVRYIHRALDRDFAKRVSLVVFPDTLWKKGFKFERISKVWRPLREGRRERAARRRRLRIRQLERDTIEVDRDMRVLRESGRTLRSCNSRKAKHSQRMLRDTISRMRVPEEGVSSSKTET